MRRKVILFILSCLALLVGLLLYLFFNKDAYISKVILDIIPIQTNTDENIVISILRGYGADLLWSISFTMIMQFILWLDKKKIIFLLFCSLLGILYELMQCFGIVPGTADIVDAIVYIFGSVLAIMIIQGGKLYEEKSDFSSSVSN